MRLGQDEINWRDHAFNLDEKRILIVDDDKGFCESVSDILCLQGYSVKSVNSANEAFPVLSSFKPHVIFLDVLLPDSIGTDLLKAVRRELPFALSVMVTAHAQVETAVDALRKGAYNYLLKPLGWDEVFLTLERCFERLQLTYEKHIAVEELKGRNASLEESNLRLRRIVEATTRITNCIHLPEFGPFLLREFADGIGALGGSLYLKRRDKFVLQHSLDNDNVAQELELPLAKGTVFARAVAEKKPLLIDSDEFWHEIEQSGWRGYVDNTALIFPLFDIDGEVVGLISLHNKVAPPFTRADLDLGRLMATYTSESLHSVNMTENMLKSEERYRRLVETMNDGLIVVDDRFCLTYANKRFCEILGYKFKDIVGQAIISFMDDSANVSFMKDVREKAGAVHESYEIVWERADGATRTTLVTPQAVKEKNTTNYCFAVITDITDRKKSEEALKQQKYEADIRVKELDCLFAISSLIDKPDININEVFERTIKVIPKALQYPDVSCVRISLDNCGLSLTGCNGEVFCSHHAEQPTEWQISHAIYASGKRIGRLYIWYRQQRPESERGPFLKEEVSLVNAVAELLGGIIERVHAEDELKTSVDKLQTTMEGIIQAMAMTSEMRDPYTAGHQRRVSKLACAIAMKMDLPMQMVDGIRLASIIHDLGKIYVPAEILSKPGVISDIEFSIIKTHAQVGHDILRKIEFPWPLSKIIHQHHERMDGSGYPLGLAGDAIMLESRIIGVADTVEAMASHRPYRPSLGIERALNEVNSNAGTLYDAEIVKVCTDLFNIDGFDF